MLNLGFDSKDQPARTAEEPACRVSLGVAIQRLSQLTIVDNDGGATGVFQSSLATISLRLDEFLKVSLLDRKDLCGRIGFRLRRRDGGHVDC